ncbi:hypothetical protein SD70_26005 [Gordoniibacillus kamchatkensis]|uniref:Helix-turn-helix domain-containing protein n=1 Tax=Gordoniibacillus kamchatkensis TaxID=1590651 RepID=A0ABR5ABU1_9BACL|nr:hypothetical protein [Paenibacillus sp. VKM B-2647]KIL38494.1 hypothetical protein SD70_26005 [Paenibacillus sp. VKM B-2647]
MKKQDPNTYTTPLKDCFKDIDELVQYIYSKDYTIKPPEKDISVTYEEIKAIIKKCPEKNQKLLAYALLIHSKRFALKSGIFYMSFPQMVKTTGLGEATVFRQVEKLIKLGVVIAEERNRKQKGSDKCLPNKYRLDLLETSENPNLENNADNIYVTQNYNDISACLQFYFTYDELKQLLPRRQYNNLIS